MQLMITDSGREYYRSVQSGFVQEFGFAFVESGEAIAIVECDNANGILGRFGFPIQAWVSSTVTYEQRKQIVVEISSELRRISKIAQLSAIQIRSAPEDDPDGLLLGCLLGQGAKLEIDIHASVDLWLTREVLAGDLRKGHRQQVRWGNKNLTFSSVNSCEPDRKRFDAYRDFHLKIAGRVTRPAESWDLMFKMLVDGSGELILGSYGGALVSGTMVLDGVDTAYYVSGVYERSQFDKPLGHAALFESIVRAKDRGLRYFDVGEIPLDGSDKEKSIGYFKQGFTSRRRASHRLTWSPI